MSKTEFLDALTRAMAGLPPDVAAKTLAYYEQRFVDGAAAGLSDAQIAAGLDDPRKIAMTLRANAHMGAFARQKSPLNLLRLLFSLLGLAIFNLFMVVPAAVFSALLLSLYASAGALYICGIVVTAGGLAGANELVLTGPLRHMATAGEARDRERAGMQTRVTISERGVQVFQEPSADLRREWDETDSRSERLLESAEAMAGSGVRISTELDEESRTAQTAIGITLTVLGIVFSLLSVVATRYSLLGLKRYFQMNAAILGGR